jgi:hypothetical protein
MSISPNMTEEHLDAVMAALPDNMEEEELCALTLTIYAAYQDDPAEVISSLITSIYTYAETRGFDRKTVSKALRLMADVNDTKSETQH